MGNSGALIKKNARGEMINCVSRRLEINHVYHLVLNGGERELSNLSHKIFPDDRDAK